MIKFNSSTPTCTELSNFHRSSFMLDGSYWPTVEHYYQAYKFLPHDPDWAEEIRASSGPGTARKLGRSTEHRMRDDWDDVKDDVMMRALRAKFAHSAACRRVLLGTGDEELVEHTPWGDAYWGDNGDGTGLNRLGELLMQLRSDLSSEVDATD